ncbi:MAG: fibronectin type III domain-containing protein [Bacteroidales bacterium]|nr:fibronectin type III domain-containing protein [Bacteroidales bacterium]
MKLKYIAAQGAIALMASLAAVSCTDGNDWEEDSSYDRLFSPVESNLSVSAKATEAEVKWSLVKDAESYLIEVSTDSLYNEVALGGPAATVYGQDGNITSSPFTLTDLMPDTQYFLRIKSQSAGKNESKWTYLTDKSFKTKTEQIIEHYSVAWNGVTLSWPANSKADRVEVLDEAGQTLQTLALSADDLSAGTCTVSGLSPLTPYQVILFNGSAKRGVISFTTPAKVPDADKVVYLAASDSLNNTLFEELAAEGIASVTVALPAGSTYYNASTVNIPDGLSVNFFGIAGGEQPVLAISMLNIAGKHDVLTFENLTITSAGKDAEGNAKNADYFINQSAACEVGSIEFSNCTLEGFTNTPFRLQGSDVKVIGQLTFSNCLVFTSNLDKYAVVHVDAGSGKGVVNNILLSRTTVAGASKSFIYCNKTNFESLVIEDCTLSGLSNSGRYFMDCGASNGPTTFIIRNTLLGSLKEGSKGARSKTTPTVDNSYITTDVVFAGNAIVGFNEYDKSETSLFRDPANRDFTIIDNSFGGKKSCGDPRWYFAD